MKVIVIIMMVLSITIIDLPWFFTNIAKYEPKLLKILNHTNWLLECSLVLNFVFNGITTYQTYMIGVAFNQFLHPTEIDTIQSEVA